MGKFELDEPTMKSIKLNTGVSDKLADSIRPIVEQQERLKEITRPFTEVSEHYKAMVAPLNVCNPAYERLVSLQKSIAEVQLNTTPIAIDAISDSLKSMSLRLAPLYSEIQTSKLIEAVGNTLSSSIAVSMQNIIPNFSSVLLEAIQSPLLDWIKSFDFSPWTRIFENLQFPDLGVHKDELDEIYLRAMYDAKWFPYAGWQADAKLFVEVTDILNSSRGMSKRCEKRIDKAILSYYTKSEIKRIKKEWNASELDSYVKKALGQTLEAYLRGEYALVIPFLATMWEGLIYIKAHNVLPEERQRQKMAITKQELSDLTKSNNYDKIFSDYFNDFIVSQCNKVSDVVEGVPNRHSTSHSWYVKYPTKKAALNAILLTDFIIKLEPTHKNENTIIQTQEDNSNG